MHAVQLMSHTATAIGLCTAKIQPPAGKLLHTMQCTELRLEREVRGGGKTTIDIDTSYSLTVWIEGLRVRVRTGPAHLPPTYFRSLVQLLVLDL